MAGQQSCAMEYYLTNWQTQTSQVLSHQEFPWISLCTVLVVGLCISGTMFDLPNHNLFGMQLLFNPYMAAFKIDSYRVNFLCFSWLDICQQDSSLLILGESTRLKSKHLFQRPLDVLCLFGPDRGFPTFLKSSESHMRVVGAFSRSLVNWMYCGWKPSSLVLTCRTWSGGSLKFDGVSANYLFSSSGDLRAFTALEQKI